LGSDWRPVDVVVKPTSLICYKDKSRTHEDSRLDLTQNLRVTFHTNVPFPYAFAFTIQLKNGSHTFASSAQDKEKWEALFRKNTESISGDGKEQSVVARESSLEDSKESFVDPPSQLSPIPSLSLTASLSLSSESMPVLTKNPNKTLIPLPDRRAPRGDRILQRFVEPKDESEDVDIKEESSSSYISKKEKKYQNLPLLSQVPIGKENYARKR